MDAQVTLSILDLIIGVAAFVVGWFLGQYWKAHGMGAMTVQQRLAEVATNSRASDYVEQVSPQVKAYINEAVAKATLPKV